MNLIEVKAPFSSITMKYFRHNFNENLSENSVLILNRKTAIGNLIIHALNTADYFEYKNLPRGKYETIKIPDYRRKGLKHRERFLMVSENLAIAVDKMIKYAMCLEMNLAVGDNAKKGRKRKVILDYLSKMDINSEEFSYEAARKTMNRAKLICNNVDY